MLKFYLIYLKRSRYFISVSFGPFVCAPFVTENSSWHRSHLYQEESGARDSHHWPVGLVRGKTRSKKNDELVQALISYSWHRRNHWAKARRGLLNKEVQVEVKQHNAYEIHCHENAFCCVVYVCV